MCLWAIYIFPGSVHIFSCSRARLFKRLWSPGIDSQASIPPAYVAWARICRRLWTLRHRFQESSLYEKFILTWTWDMGTSTPYLFPNRFRESIFHPLTRLQIPALAGRYDKPIPTRCLALMTFLKIPAQNSQTGGEIYKSLTYTCMWKLEPRPYNTFSGNIVSNFLYCVFAVCRWAYSLLWTIIFDGIKWFALPKSDKFMRRKHLNVHETVLICHLSEYNTVLFPLTLKLIYVLIMILFLKRMNPGPRMHTCRGKCRECITNRSMGIW